MRAILRSLEAWFCCLRGHWLELDTEIPTGYVIGTHCTRCGEVFR